MDAKPLTLHYAHTDGHTSISYTPNTSHILSCGSDGDVRIWKDENDGDPMSECVGEMAIALAVASENFYVAAENNYVQAYTFPGAKRDGIVCRFTAPVTHIDCNSEGGLIAAGSCDMEIQVVERETNKVIKMIGHTAPITGVALDPMGKFLASASCDGSMKIWNLSDGECIKSIDNLFPKCNDFFRAVILGRPSWQPELGRFIAVPFENKVRLYCRDSWVSTNELKCASLVSKISLATVSPCGNYVAASTTSGDIVIWELNEEKVVGLFVHPKKAAFSCLSWRHDSKSLAVCDRLGHYVAITDVIDGAASLLQGNENEEVVNPMDEDGNDDVDLEDVLRNVPNQADGDDDVSSVVEISSIASEKVATAKITPLQPPFQPSATPVFLQHRFMLWNGIGMIRSFNTEDDNAIDVEFHDTSFHHGLHMNNYDGYTMAALSRNTLALAAEATDDTPSKINCIVLNAWDGTKEWATLLPADESIMAIAAADKWVAIATNMNHLRIFSASGTQRQPIALPGQVVCLTGWNNKIAVVYHQGLGLPDCQNLGVIIYEIEDLFVRSSLPPQSLPISPGTTLKWLGFTDEGRLCTFDSKGILRCLGFDGSIWSLLADTRTQSKGPSDHYFIIGVSERYQKIQCLLCKGSYYPMTTPRPTVVEIPLKLPLCDPENDKSNLEETFWRLMFSLPTMQTTSEAHDDYTNDLEDMEKTLKQTIIKLFANALTGDADMRALELAELMTEKSLQVALKYAAKHGKNSLTDKLGDLSSLDWAELKVRAAHKVSTIYMTANATNGHTDEVSNNYGGYDSSQRDIFEATPKEQAGDNILLNVEASPLTFPEATPKYPFKVNEKSGARPKGLSYFDKPPVVKTAPPKSKTLKTKVDNMQEKKKKLTFVDWFNSRKDSLSQEYPSLSTSELTKKAMTLFREESAQSNDSQKRKLDISDESVYSETAKKKANSVLSMFSFNE